MWKEILKRILNSNTLKDILKYYPYKSTPFKQRLFTSLLKLKLVYPLLVLAKLQGLHKI